MFILWYVLITADNAFSVVFDKFKESLSDAMLVWHLCLSLLFFFSFVNTGEAFDQFDLETECNSAYKNCY